MTSELAPGHKLGNAVTQAYARSDMLEQRRGLMERWGNHLMMRQIEEAWSTPCRVGLARPLRIGQGDRVRCPIGCLSRSRPIYV